jgi:flagellar motility protein MotE (MotC chaperone)
MSVAEEQMKISQVLEATADALEKTAHERDTAVQENLALKEKLAQIEQRLECEKTAAEMHEKGLNLDWAYNDLVEDLVKQAGEGRLPVVREAVKMAAPNMGHRIGNINTDEQRGEAGSELVSFLVGDVG